MILLVSHFHVASSQNSSLEQFPDPLSHLSGPFPRDLRDDYCRVSFRVRHVIRKNGEESGGERLTMQSHNTEDENKGKNENNDGIDLQSWGFVGVESYLHMSALIPSLV